MPSPELVSLGARLQSQWLARSRKGLRSSFAWHHFSHLSRLISLKMNLGHGHIRRADDTIVLSHQTMKEALRRPALAVMSPKLRDLKSNISEVPLEARTCTTQGSPLQ